MSKKLKLADYEVGVTLGTGTHATTLTPRLVRARPSRQVEGNRQVLRREDPEEGGDHKDEASRPYHEREPNPLRHRPSAHCKREALVTVRRRFSWTDLPRTIATCT